MNIFIEYFWNRPSHCVHPTTQQPASPLIPVIQRGSRLKERMQWGILRVLGFPSVAEVITLDSGSLPSLFCSLASLIFCQTTRVWQRGQLANGTLKPPTVHTWRMKLWYVLLIVTLSLASLSWSSSSEKLKPATVMKSPITATNLSPRSLVLLCW